MMQSPSPAGPRSTPEPASAAKMPTSSMGETRSDPGAAGHAARPAGHPSGGSLQGKATAEGHAAEGDSGDGDESIPLGCPDFWDESLMRARQVAETTRRVMRRTKLYICRPLTRCEALLPLPQECPPPG